MQVASYAKQTSSGVPLILNGIVNDAAVRALSYFDIVTLEITPFGCDVDGNAKGIVPLLLRKYNPYIKIFLYTLVGDQWLPPTFVVGANDRSGFAKIFNAVNLTDGWLYGVDGNQWIPNYRVNLGHQLTVSALINVYESLISTHLFDGIFLDDCHTSIAWTDSAQRRLDYTRAGFSSLLDMDTRRFANITNLISYLKQIGGTDFKVALNGTGPKPGNLDIDFREGLDSLISTEAAITWMRTPGTHWLMANAYGMSDPLVQTAINIGQEGDSIITCGPNRDVPSFPIPK